MQKLVQCPMCKSTNVLCPACGSDDTILQAEKALFIPVTKLKVVDGHNMIVNEKKWVIRADYLLCLTCTYQWKIDYLHDAEKPSSLPEDVTIPTYSETIKRG